MFLAKARTAKVAHASRKTASSTANTTRFRSCQSKPRRMSQYLIFRGLETSSATVQTAERLRVRKRLHAVSRDNSIRNLLYRRKNLQQRNTGRDTIHIAFAVWLILSPASLAELRGPVRRPRRYRVRLRSERLTQKDLTGGMTRYMNGGDDA